MPDMDGTELAAAFRARGETAPILLLSSAPSAVSARATEVGITAVLQKPLLRRDLLNKVAQLGLDPAGR